MKKQWKEIPNFNGTYFISDTGEVLSIPKLNGVGKVKLIKCELKNGYIKVKLSKDAKKHHRLIHRLVAEYFIPNPENKPCVNHINGIKTDNRIENLEWVSHSENTQHAIKLGLMNTCMGENHYLSKIKNQDIITIRNDYKNKTITQSSLALRYKVSRRTITDILSYRSHRISI